MELVTATQLIGMEWFSAVVGTLKSQKALFLFRSYSFNILFNLFPLFLLRNFCYANNFPTPCSRITLFLFFIFLIFYLFIYLFFVCPQSNAPKLDDAFFASLVEREKETLRREAEERQRQQSSLLQQQAPPNGETPPPAAEPPSGPSPHNNATPVEGATNTEVRTLFCGHIIFIFIFYIQLFYLALFGAWMIKNKFSPHDSLFQRMCGFQLLSSWWPSSYSFWAGTEVKMCSKTKFFYINVGECSTLCCSKVLCFPFSVTETSGHLPKSMYAFYCSPSRYFLSHFLLVNHN